MRSLRIILKDVFYNINLFFVNFQSRFIVCRAGVLKTTGRRTTSPTPICFNSLIIIIFYTKLNVFSFHFCKHHTDLQHGSARGCCRVKRFIDGAKLNLMLLKFLIHSCEIQKITADSIQLVNHYFCNLVLLDIGKQPLKFWSLYILSAVPFVCINFNRKFVGV